MGSTGVTFRAKKEPTMRKITILFAMLLVLAVARPAHALVSYTFTGGGFDGTLFLDDSVPFVITPPHLISIPGLTSPIFFDFTTGTLDSVLNFVSGSFGDFTFFGRPELNIFQDERPDPPAGRVDDWILTSQVVGPPVGGVVPISFSLIFSVLPNVRIDISLTPPGPLASAGLSFSDGTGHTAVVTVSGPVPVPEPAVAVLLILSASTVLIVHRLRSRNV
jgi:hypothetical protein